MRSRRNTGTFNSTITACLGFGKVYFSPYVIVIHFKFDPRRRQRPQRLNDSMKLFYNKFIKPKKPSLGSIHTGPGPATSRSTRITSTADLMPFIPASDATASAQVTADGVSVSFAHRIFKHCLIVIEQTAHNLGVSTSVSALETSDLLPVSVPTAGVN